MRYLYFLLMLAYVSGIVTERLCHRCPEVSVTENVKTITSTKTVHDTVTLYYPRLVFSQALDTIYVPADTMLVRETKEYADSTYHAYVSGIAASLDSISVYPSTVYVNTDREIVRTISIARRKKWNIGLTAGYGLTVKGAHPYVGLGVTYNPFAR